MLSAEATASPPAGDGVVTSHGPVRASGTCVVEDASHRRFGEIERAIREADPGFVAASEPRSTVRQGGQGRDGRPVAAGDGADDDRVGDQVDAALAARRSRSVARSAVRRGSSSRRAPAPRRPPTSQPVSPAVALHTRRTWRMAHGAWRMRALRGTLLGSSPGAPGCQPGWAYGPPIGSSASSARAQRAVHNTVLESGAVENGHHGGSKCVDLDQMPTDVVVRTVDARREMRRSDDRER